MIQLLTASTLFQVASLAAMIDAGALPAPRGERVLLLIDGSQQPELTGSIADSPGFGDLASRFDRVEDFGELLLPRRPAQFNPREEELYLWQRLLRRGLGLGAEDVQLVVDSIQANPARAILRIFHDSLFLVHSDGLMTYGPTRNLLPASIHQRLDGLLYLDLVPGLQPLLLREFAPPLIPVPPQPLADLIAGLARSTMVHDPRPAANGRPKTALVLGQYLAHLGLMDDEEERVLHREMLREAERHGATAVIFKPHPAAGPASGRQLEEDAAALGLQFTPLQEPVLAETAVALLRPDVVISCFSTALLTIRAIFGTETAAVGTEMMLERLSPYENSNRIPVTLIDALHRRGLPLPGDDPLGSEGSLTRLVTAVGYCMQPQRLAAEEATTREFLAGHHARFAKYFKRRRLTRLDLPGALPAGRPAPGLAARLTRRLPARVHRRLGRGLRSMPRRLSTVASCVARG
ncbi:polysialyltransferase family glycosyltransferase [Arthrobacter sp. AOP36-C1-22]|uniref:polysialyltransferase family glycosyltransferase n=1 Tax=Arthrobacter sp. AOP36-C1-22 TaxID=3457683 RepID=UPI0040345B87